MRRCSTHRSVWFLVVAAVLAGTSACGDGAGRSVSVGRVTVLVSEPADAGMDALHAGRLQVVGGCLGVGDAVVVWPHGTEVVSEDPLQVRVPGAEPYALGDDVEIGGGFVLEHSPDDHVEPGPHDVAGVTVPAPCARHDVFLAH